jgi:hypothetical protein
VTPEEALALARERAEPYDDGTVAPVAARIGDTQLAEWAVIKPDVERVYSTRRFGAPITAFKRMLLRLLRQYVDEALAQETRYNALATAYILNLEERVRELEAKLEDAK